MLSCAMPHLNEHVLATVNREGHEVEDCETCDSFKPAAPQTRHGFNPTLKDKQTTTAGGAAQGILQSSGTDFPIAGPTGGAGVA